MLHRFCFALLVIFAAGGCVSGSHSIAVKSESELREMEERATTAAIAFRQGRYEEAEKILLELTNENTVSRPLYLAELGAIYIAQGRTLEARKTLMQAQGMIELLFDTKAEAEAASLFGGEIKKVYKGEPYERSSLYAILALLFLNEGDVDNALACCKSGLLHDADSSGEVHSSDHALLYFLASRCHQIRGDAEDAERMRNAAVRALGIRSQGESDSGGLPDTDGNVLLVFWVGTGPSLLPGGEYNEKRMILPGRSTVDALAVVRDDIVSDLCCGYIGDVSYQATTRGGRVMDNVLRDQAALKGGTQTAGNILLGAGVAAAAVNPYVGLGVIGAGLLAHGVSYAMNPVADVRHWKNLPDRFVLASMRLEPGEHKLRALLFTNAELVATRPFSVAVNADIPLNTRQVVLYDEPSATGVNSPDAPLVFMRLILDKGYSAVFNETQVKLAADKLYRQYNATNGIWPKEVLYYIEHSGQQRYPVTARFKAWQTGYSELCGTIFKQQKPEAAQK